MNCCFPFINEPLPYGYEDLEPCIDGKTMYLHHQKHLQSYIDNLNRLIEKNPVLKKWNLQELLTSWCRLPCYLQEPVRRNAGGVYNHRFYFEGMIAIRDREAEDFGREETWGNPVKREIEGAFGGSGDFRNRFKTAALSVFGSGYAWLVWEKGNFKIVTSVNQNTPDLSRQLPLLNVDVWEHAYYLKHDNDRSMYLENWFRLINWNQVQLRLREGMSGRRALGKMAE